LVGFLSACVFLTSQLTNCLTNSLDGLRSDDDDDDDDDNDNNNNNNKLQLGCHPVAVVILRVYKI